MTSLSTRFKPMDLTGPHLDFSNRMTPVDLPAGLRPRSANLADRKWMTELPADLRCYELDLKRTPIRRLPPDLRVVFRLDLQGCTELSELPPNLRVGTLVLRDCTSLERLPDGLDVNFLDIRGCTALADWPDEIRIRVGRLNLSGCRRITKLPEGLGRLSQLDVSDCVGLRELPEGLDVASSLELAGSGLTGLPVSMARTPNLLRWRGVRIDERIAFRPHEVTTREVLDEPNAERRRTLLDRMGLDRFFEEANAKVLDEDVDAGGLRRLLHVPLPDDEDLVVVMVFCPSTGGRYLLRVPPEMKTCRQAVAWTAGYDDPDAYRPLVET